MEKLTKKPNKVADAYWTAMEMLNKAWHWDSLFICPFCDAHLDVPKDTHCRVVNCDKCGYSYCVVCGYVYSPEPNWCKLLDVKKVEYRSIMLEYLTYDFKTETANTRFVLLGIEISKIESFYIILLEFIRNNHNNPGNIALEKIIAHLDKLIYSYEELEENNYYHIETITIENTDGVYIKQEKYLFECEPFF